MTSTSVVTQRKLQLAVERANNVLTRPSSIAADEFLDQWDHSCNDAWKSLPHRLERLALRLDREHQQRPKGNDSVSFAAAVFARAPPSLPLYFQQLFTAALQARQTQWEHDNSMTMLDDSNNDDDNNLDDDTTGIDFDQVFSSLRTLGWITSSPMVHKALLKSMHDMNAQTIATTITRHYEDYGMWDAVNSWKKHVLQPWLLHSVLGNDTDHENEWGPKLDFAIAEAFVQVRTDELFDIVAEFPESQPAVEELREALNNTTHVHKTRLAVSLRENLQRRLLHPGANTSQILDVYISAIKVLRVIDPSDGLLDMVAEPVKMYLRGRNDTVRCIITGLTDEKSGGELYEELRRQDATLLEQGYDSEDDDDPPDPNWTPFSTPQQQAFTANKFGTAPPPTSSKRGDILAMLVGVYGSQELFVNEYRMMLADKLLANLEFDTDKEVHTLELLKLRFGDASLRQCEIMIKDIDDSKRIVSNIHSTIQTKASHRRQRAGLPTETKDDDDEPSVVDAAIVSHIFWPPLLKDDLKVHPKIQAQLDQFGNEYANLKNPRKLLWLSQLGTVQMELELDDDGRTREFTCSPLHATLISHFEDEDSWTAADLSNETGVSEDIIKKKMGYWLNQRIVQCAFQPDGSATYTLAPSTWDEDSHGAGATDGAMMEEEEDEDSMAAAKGSHDAEEMKVYESYIVGMLTNLGQLPLDRIHNMLKMFVTGSDHKYDKTPHELSAFLGQLCKLDKLEFVDGMYKLVKKR